MVEVPADVSNIDREFLRDNILRWGRENYSNFPWRSTENEWHALVAELMLQRTKAEQVLEAYKAFVATYPEPSVYAKDEYASAFANLGLHWREPLLKKLAITLSNNPIPHGKEELLELPGIGPYIAAAFRSMHIGIKDTIIDSNVVRLYGRFFGFQTDGETRRKKWFIHLAKSITPHTDFTAYNYGLLDFTREICTPKPTCERCPLNLRCRYYRSNQR